MPLSKLMKIAFAEQLKTTSFPKVGAVIAKGGELLATGYRGEIERHHAERVAIQKLKPEQLRGATLFTTLEPCVEIFENQIQSCTELIVQSGLYDVYIGVLDPNGTIYSQGFETLLNNGLKVHFFSERLREKIEQTTFKNQDIGKMLGGGKRRVAVIHGGTEMTVQFSRSDERSIKIRWQTLQPSHGIVDLHSSNDAVTHASGLRNFSDITDPLVFRFPRHCARMKVGNISVVRPKNATFCLLVKLLELNERDISFQVEVRNIG